MCVGRRREEKCEQGEQGERDHLVSVALPPGRPTYLHSSTKSAYLQCVGCGFEAALNLHGSAATTGKIERPVNEAGRRDGIAGNSPSSWSRSEALGQLPEGTPDAAVEPLPPIPDDLAQDLAQILADALHDDLTQYPKLSEIPQRLEFTVASPSGSVRKRQRAPSGKAAQLGGPRLPRPR